MSQQQTATALTARVSFAQKVHKQAEGPEDNQDAFEAEPNSSRFAVADGTTTSFFSAPWARLLVQHFCNAGDADVATLQSPAHWENWLTPIRAQWQADVAASLKHARGSNAILLQNRFAEQQPAAATFVGLQFDYSRQRWQALAIGDSCLLHVRAGRLLQSIPYTQADQFSNITEAIASTPQQSPQTPILYTGEFSAGDTFYLLTDAIARWVIAQHEEGESGWQMARQQLDKLRYWDDLRSLVDAQRSTGALGNDDVTVVVLKIEAAATHAPTVFFAAPKVDARAPAPVPVHTLRSSLRAHTEQLLPIKQRRRVAGTAVLLALSLAVNAYLLIPWNRLDLASINAVLPAGTILYTAPDGNARIGRTVGEVPALSPIVAASSERRSVQLSVWLRAARDAKRDPREAGEDLVVPRGTRAFVKRGAKQPVLLLEPKKYEIVRAVDDGKHFWYLVRVDAWTARPER